MSSPPTRAPRLHLAAPSAWRTLPDAQRRALERAVDCAVRAPSVRDTEPWRFELSPDRLVIRADRTRQLTTLDPTGRELVQSVGAALFNARVALAARGWAAEVDRLPVRTTRTSSRRSGRCRVPRTPASPRWHPRSTGGGRTADASPEGTCRTRSCGG